MTKAVCQLENQNVPLSKEKYFHFKACVDKEMRKINDPTRNVVF